MGKDLAIYFESARGVWELADSLFADDTVPFHETVFPLPAFSDEERQAQVLRLTATENAQPALAGAALAHLEILRGLGLDSDFAAGHSFGEFAALHCAGVISAGDLLRVARQRGLVMSRSTRVAGAMTAVSCPVTDLQNLLDAYRAIGNSRVVIANYNSPAQTVLAGAETEIAAFEVQLATKNITFRRLPVSAAFHSPLMEGAAGPFTEFMDKIPIAVPRIPVLSNMGAAEYPAEIKEIRGILARHLNSPVQFAQQVEELYARGVRTFVELGAGSVLTGLVDSCLEGRDHLCVPLDRKGRNSITSLWHSLAQLAVSGRALNLSSLWPAFAPIAELQPVVSSASTFMIDGSNYAKPYPPAGGVEGLPKPNPRAVATPAGLPLPAASVVTTPPQSPVTSQPLLSEIQQQIANAQKASHDAILDSLKLTLKSFEALAARTADASAQAPVFAPSQVQMPPEIVSVQAPPAPVPAKSTINITDQLLNIVSDKTGYPVEVLDLDADLESGLGIDSIKRVEIFSALQEQVPGLPELNPESMANLRTLSQIILFAGGLENKSGQPQLLTASIPLVTDVEAHLLRIVSEKTGYPIEVLDLDADLESGLGIDSIKRVEIFSALEEQVSGLPELNPEHMANLRTLGQILSFVGGRGGVLPATTSTAASIDVRTHLFRIVGEKTGYPLEVLDADADLESGLGIDSIKRVEIFSSLQEQVPDLPELTPEDMARLRTLGEIAGFLTVGSPAVTDKVPGPAPESAEDHAALHQYLSAKFVAAPGLCLPGLFACGRIAVTPGSPGLNKALADQLKALGLEAEDVDEVTDGFTGVIFLGGLRKFADIDEAIAVNRKCFHAAQVIAKSPGENKLFVTVQNTGGDFGFGGTDPISPWASGLAALTKTAAAEWPEATVKAIDIEIDDRSVTEVADSVISELLNGGAQLEVGLKANGGRVVVKTISGIAAPVRELPANAVIVVSGGGRGVTAACAVELAKASVRPRVALLGRTRIGSEPSWCLGANDEAALRRALATHAKSSGNSVNLIAIQAEAAHILAMREIKATLGALESVGAETLYLPVDIREKAAVAEALNDVRSRWGAITGIIHGSGILADKRIAAKTPAMFDRVFDTKVAGLHALLAATENDPLQLIVFFSSVAARFGNAGQCDYAMANEVLNKVANSEMQRRGPDCIVKSINWGPWAGGMVDSSLAGHFKSRGIALLPLDSGSHAFVSEILGKQGDSAEVVLTAQGAPVIPASSLDRERAEILVNSRTYPFLNGHRIRKIPVVPALLVLEWFYRAAAELHPDVHADRCEDLRVLSGIVLTDFEGQGCLLYIHCEGTGDPHRLHCRLRSREGKLHYSATLVSVKAALAQPVWREPFHLDGHSNGKEFYPSQLFHGPEFQIIHHLYEMTNRGASAILTGTDAMGWIPEGPWKTDVAGLDGALQVIRLLTNKELGGPSLPTRIGGYTRLSGEPIEGLMNCIVRCRTVGKLRSISDVTLTSLEGRPLAEMQEVEMHVTAEAE